MLPRVFGGLFLFAITRVESLLLVSSCKGEVMLFMPPLLVRSQTPGFCKAARDNSDFNRCCVNII